jgi:hypothetical protein
VHFLEGYQGNFLEFWDAFGEGMSSELPSLTLDTFKYARALVSSTAVWIRDLACGSGFQALGFICQSDRAAHQSADRFGVSLTPGQLVKLI